MRLIRRCPLATLALALAASTTLAAQQPGPPNLLTASLEDLMNINVTSAARKEQRVAEVPSAVYVITQDAIRRSGLTSVPELLRLAPGVQVAHIDASKWAVSIRGFNKRWSDKLLVLIDGRTLYNRQFSGVYWDSVNVMVEDIERIEVVRGPGGAVWGANAVDGVVNIITKTSRETEGALVRASIGTQEEGSTAIRYGGAFGRTAYRVHADWQQRGHSMLDASVDAPDRWRALNSGVRLDWKGDGNELTLDTGVQQVDGNSFAALVDGPTPPAGGWPTYSQTTVQTGGHALGKWTRHAVAGGTLELQGFVEHVDRRETAFHYFWTTADVDAKFQRRVAGRHEIVGGLGYRRTDDTFDGSFAVSITPAQSDLSIFNAFAQDEVRLADERLRLTLGGKVEHETFSGWGVQPTARALWALGQREHLWAAASRARRTPARADRGLHVNITSFPGPMGLPIVIQLLGNPAYRTETLTSVEGGFRIERARLSVDVSTFYSHHDGTQTQEPIPPHVEILNGRPALVMARQFTNLMTSDSQGVEIAGRWSPAQWWFVDANYAFFHLTPHPAATSLDEKAPLFDGNAPAHQWQIRPALTIGRFDADLGASRVGALESFGVPGYTRVDARAEWRVTPRVSLVMTGQNLTDDVHAEFGGLENATTVTLDPRRVAGKVTWRY